MSEKEFLKAWYTGLAVATGVVVAVAALLVTIIGVARGILRNGTRALDVANEIVTNTRPTWDLDQTNGTASLLLEGAQAIEQHATELADALGGTPPRT
ncbi:MAG TPA: hypothetical protein VGR16_07275 [Thermomicrobiales bacterium]|nr:hypothetical protein [Thermomicrobiales bacterium]